jgi:hypothetical protein
LNWIELNWMVLLWGLQAGWIFYTAGRTPGGSAWRSLGSSTHTQGVRTAWAQTLDLWKRWRFRFLVYRVQRTTCGQISESRKVLKKTSVFILQIGCVRSLVL